MNRQRMKPAMNEAQELIASLRYLPEALFAFFGPLACLLSVFLFTGAI